MPHVADDADDLPLFASEQGDLADGVAVGPEPRGHRLVDHQNLLRVGGVVCSELAARAQRNLHRPYVAWVYQARECVRVRLRGVGLPLRRHAPTAIATERQGV